MSSVARRRVGLQQRRDANGIEDKDSILQQLGGPLDEIEIIGAAQSAYVRITRVAPHSHRASFDSRLSW
jgi:hypothetical protein